MTGTRETPESPAPRLPRRFLPSMSLLVAFEAAARLKSFTAAASELNLTQSAVSRQIRALEEALGGELFKRDKQTVSLTLAGESYVREVRESLRRIASATLAFRGNPGGGTLNVGILPAFGTRWLAPRLPRFLDSHPDITINLQTRLAPFDFSVDTLDAAIHFGAPDWPGADVAFLMNETVVPACSPDYRARYRFEKVADLAAASLLHIVSRPDAWERWFRANDVDVGDIHGMLVDQFAVAAEAAIAGLGIALLPKFLFHSELERGSLVTAIDRPVTSTDAYYLVWPRSRTDYPPLRAFREWITSQ